MAKDSVYDAIVIGGGPAGATAAIVLARQGRRVALLDKAGRIKPCGGAIPPRLIKDFDVPDNLIVAKINTARVVAPSTSSVDMHIDTMDARGGYVGMIDREHFDEWQRNKAALAGATRIAGTFEKLDVDANGQAKVQYITQEGSQCIVGRVVIGADGARSEIARQAMPNYRPPPSVFAYHEIIRSPEGDDTTANFDKSRCDVVYDGRYSPDFYGWVFPHGATTSIGVGSAVKGFSLRRATREIRQERGLDGCETIRREGAPIPLKPLKRWDNGRNVVLAGDAAGVVAPASGEGIYYAMLTGQLAGEAAGEFIRTGNPKSLRVARKEFMASHGRIFWILRMMQYFWYRNDKRRERFVKICNDRDVQRLTWQSYMHKELVKTDPLVQARIFFKDLAHLFGVART